MARSFSAAGLRSATGPRQRSIILALVCVAQFMVVLDVSIVNVALPDMQNDLHMSSTALQWVINAYTLTFAGFLLLGGRAADLWGRRRLFLIGLVTFAGMSLLGGLAQSGGQIIGARSLQGLGGAVLSPATLTILTVTFTEPKERVRALGLWSAMAAAGGATGVLFGGILTDLLSWRWILFINVPIGIATAIVARLTVPESRAERTDGVRTRLDWLGALLVTGGLTVVVYGIVSTDTRAWGSPATLGTLAVGLALLATFVLVEQRHPQPLVPLRLFRSRGVTGANLFMIIQGSAMFAIFYFLSLYEQDVHGYSPLKTGFAFLPMPLAILAGTRLAARLVPRLGVDRRRSRPAVAGVPQARLELPARRRPPRRAADLRRRAGLRPDHPRRHHRRRSAGRRSRLRTHQHHPPDRRLDRARRARHRCRGAAARRGDAARRGRRRPARAADRHPPAPRGVRRDGRVRADVLGAGGAVHRGARDRRVRPAPHREARADAARPGRRGRAAGPRDRLSPLSPRRGLCPSGHRSR
jgi:MFS family permease